MLKKPMSGLNAQKLRIILIVSIVILLALSIAGFIFARGLLATYANKVQQTTATANASSKDLDTLNKLKTKLSQDSDAVQRTKDIIAESKSYQYQNQIISDIGRYAAIAQIPITSYTFADTGTKASGAVAPAAPSTSSPALSSPTQAGATTVSGLKSVSVSIALGSAVSYESIMTFIHSIEQNLTKMQLSGVTLTSDTKGKVTAGALTLEVYVR